MTLASFGPLKKVIYSSHSHSSLTLVLSISNTRSVRPIVEMWCCWDTFCPPYVRTPASSSFSLAVPRTHRAFEANVDRFWNFKCNCNKTISCRQILPSRLLLIRQFGKLIFFTLLVRFAHFCFDQCLTQLARYFILDCYTFVKKRCIVSDGDERPVTPLGGLHNTYVCMTINDTAL